MFRKRLDSNTCLKAIPEKMRTEILAVSENGSISAVQSKKNSIAGLLPFRLNKLSTVSSPFTNFDLSGQPNSPSGNCHTPSSLTALGQEGHKLRESSFSNSATRLDKLINGQQAYNSLEDYMSFDCKDNNNFNQLKANKDFTTVSTNALDNVKGLAMAKLSRASLEMTHANVLGSSVYMSPMRRKL